MNIKNCDIGNREVKNLLLGKLHESSRLNLLSSTCYGLMALGEDVAVYHEQECGASDVLRVGTVAEMDHSTCIDIIYRKMNKY